MIVPVSSRLRRTAVRLGAAATALALLTGCGGGGVSDLPLPGGAKLGKDPLTVTAEFDDVLDLVPQSAVKVNDVAVGRVTKVQMDDWHAKVTMKLNRDVRLPDNALATIRQTSILGEKFVSLAPPTNGPTGRLTSGDNIPLERTDESAEIEQVLGALSLVLNGGALGKVQVISRELNTALSGREADVRALLSRLDEFVATADDSKDDLVKALEQLDLLARQTRAQKASIDSALDNLPAALRTVEEQRANLVKMLAALERLGTVGTQVIARSKDAITTDLRALDPVLANLSSAGDALITSLEVLPTFPFPDSLLGKNLTEATNYQMGNYLNASVDFNTDFTSTIGLLSPAERRSLKASLTTNGVASVMAKSVVTP